MIKAKRTMSGLSDEAASFAAEPRKPLAQRLYEQENPQKRPVNLTASAYWLHEAKALGLNLSDVFGSALEKAVRDAHHAQLRAEIAEYDEWHANHLEKHGLWNEKFRTF